MDIKTKKIEFDMVTRFLRRSSVITAYMLNKLSVSPNCVTIGRFVLLGLPAFYCFYLGTYFWNIFGLCLLILESYFDLVDGDLARQANKESKLGVFLENQVDSLALNILILAITLNFYMIDSLYVLAGIFCLFGQIFSGSITRLLKDKFNLDCVEGNPILETVLIKNNYNVWEKFIVELITPKNFFMSLFSTFRYFLILGVFLNILPIMVLLYTIAINLRWIFLTIFLAIYYSKLKTEKTSGLIATLQQLESH
ncbi:MAG: CDP-alcohol phosphatidyltransferase family protein [Nanoarchaeota archaeon]|nr:CDP-alcohol phosphatidyltransferase family protein [Nanoarchaeota archaeon]